MHLCINSLNNLEEFKFWQSFLWYQSLMVNWWIDSFLFLSSNKIGSAEQKWGYKFDWWRNSSKGSIRFQHRNANILVYKYYENNVWPISFCFYGILPYQYQIFTYMVSGFCFSFVAGAQWKTFFQDYQANSYGWIRFGSFKLRRFTLKDYIIDKNKFQMTNINHKTIWLTYIHNFYIHR